MNGRKEKKVVVAETAEKLSKSSYQKRVWLAARNMLILKLNWPEEVNDTIRNFDGCIIFGNRIWPTPDIEKILGNESGDSSCCFFDCFEKDNHEHRCEARFIDRLRLIDLYFKIKYPKIARHFDK